MSVKSADGADILPSVIAGVLGKIPEMTAFMNPTSESYKRFGSGKAPQYIAWSPENRSQLVRVPAAFGEYRRAELRSPDPTANPYLAFSLIIYAGLDGIKQRLTPPPAAEFNAYKADGETLGRYERLPDTLDEALKLADQSEFIGAYIPKTILDIYHGR